MELTNVVSLSATAEKEVEQDLISITFECVQMGPDPQQVQDHLKIFLKEAVQVATPFKSGNKFRIETGGMSVQPQYGTKGEMKGYHGRVTLIISGTDVAGVSKMTTDIKSMAVTDVQMSVSRATRRKHEEALAKTAIKLFRDKANTYAEAFGAKGAALVNATVNVDNGGRHHYRPMRGIKALSVGASAPDMEVESGKETLSATVNGTIQLVKA